MDSDTKTLISQQCSMDSSSNLESGAQPVNTDPSDNERRESCRGNKVRCPTCHGVGWVREEEQGQLVALIPLKDHRLKPRRTVLYVIGSVLLCGLIGGLCGFFLYPRDVSLHSNKPLLQPASVLFENNSVRFFVTNNFNLTNRNYYAAPLHAVHVSAVVNKVEVATANWKDKSGPRKVDSRSTLEFPINVTFHFYKDNVKELVQVCKDDAPWVHILYVTFMITVDYSVLGHNQEVSESFLQRVVCHPPTPYVPFHIPSTSPPP